MAQDRRPPHENRRLSLSNRKGKASIIEGPAGQTGCVVGIDRLSVSFPALRFEHEAAAWDTVQVTAPGMPGERRKLSAMVPVSEGVKAFVGVQEIPDHPRHRWWGKVELNPSRVVDPGGHELLGPELLTDVMQGVVDKTSEWVVSSVSVPEMGVKRIDVARDFTDVDDATPMVRALAAVHRPYSRVNLLHADAQRNGAQTLMVGAKSAGLVRLYDQHAAYESPEGSLRFEAECRDWASRCGDVRKLHDVTRSSAMALAADRWKWSGFGVEVAGSLSTLLREVVASGVGAQQARGFVAWLLEQAGGVSLGAMSTSTLATYRRLQRSLKLAAPSDVRSTVSVVRWLDFEKGTVMRRVA